MYHSYVFICAHYTFLFYVYTLVSLTTILLLLLLLIAIIIILVKKYTDLSAKDWWLAVSTQASVGTTTGEGRDVEAVA